MWFSRAFVTITEHDITRIRNLSWRKLQLATKRRNFFVNIRLLSIFFSFFFLIFGSTLKLRMKMFAFSFFLLNKVSNMMPPPRVIFIFSKWMLCYDVTYFNFSCNKCCRWWWRRRRLRTENPLWCRCWTLNTNDMERFSKKRRAINFTLSEDLKKLRVWDEDIYCILTLKILFKLMICLFVLIWKESQTSTWKDKVREITRENWKIDVSGCGKVTNEGMCLCVYCDA